MQPEEKSFTFLIRVFHGDNAQKQPLFFYIKAIKSFAKNLAYFFDILIL